MADVGCRGGAGGLEAGERRRVGQQGGVGELAPADGRTLGVRQARDTVLTLSVEVCVSGIRAPSTAVAGPGISAAITPQT